jgi:hypothetical protein
VCGVLSRPQRLQAVEEQLEPELEPLVERSRTRPGQSVEKQAGLPVSGGA